jgi:dephospho-CoA kinase
MNRSLRVGLTGGLAGGKSTVAGWMRDAGFLVVDADKLVSELYQPGSEGAAAVRALLGPDFLNEEGSVIPAKVAEKIFADPDTRLALEKAIHPLVRKRFAEIAEAHRGVVVLEATLLVEAGYAPDFDCVITVECDGETRLRRAVARGMNEAAARSRLLAQGDGDARRAAAHRHLDNCCDLGYLRHQVDELIEELRRLAER